MGDDYIIGAVIGEGLMGPRHAGRYRPSGHPVALEEVPHTLLNWPDFVERLASAARQATAVRDLQVVPVYDLVRIGQRLYVVTELVRGRTVAALLGTDRALPLPAALLIADSVLAGLDAIHQAGMAHGDICPDTVLVTPAGSIRVTELGVTAVLAADPKLSGWPAVEPPEGGAPSAGADLYATGALLRELVTGLRPEVDGDWPPRERAGLLIQRSLSAEPAGRFPTAAEFQQEVQRIAAELFGTGWRSQGHLAGRASRPLGPQTPRPRLGRAVSVPFPEAPRPPVGSAGPVQPSRSSEPGVAPVLAAPPPPPPPPEATWPPGTAKESAVPAPPMVMSGPDPFDVRTSPGVADAGPVARDRQSDGAPPPRRSSRRWGRRLAIVATVLVVVAAAATAGVLALRPAAPAPAVTGPLEVGSGITLTIQPGSTGGCGTTFTFTATGPLSGAGTLTYRWVTSTSGSTPVYNQYSVSIARDEGSFRFTTPLRLTGPATLDGTVTFQVLSPQARSMTRTFQYSCAH